MAFFYTMPGFILALTDSRWRINWKRKTFSLPLETWDRKERLGHREVGS